MAIVDVPGMHTGNRIYNHQERKPRDKWSSGKIWSTGSSGLKPRVFDADACPDCGGLKTIIIKQRDDGRTKYQECKTCKFPALMKANLA